MEEEIAIWKRWTKAKLEHQREVLYHLQKEWELSSIKFLMTVLSKREKERIQMKKMRVFHQLKKNDQEAEADHKKGTWNHHQVLSQKQGQERNWSQRLVQKTPIESCMNKNKLTDSITLLILSTLVSQLFKVFWLVERIHL